jgi:hypothetical protein
MVASVLHELPILTITYKTCTSLKSWYVELTPPIFVIPSESTSVTRFTEYNFLTLYFDKLCGRGVVYTSVWRKITAYILGCRSNRRIVSWKILRTLYEMKR